MRVDGIEQGGEGPGTVWEVERNRIPALSHSACRITLRSRMALPQILQMKKQAQNALVTCRGPQLEGGRAGP